MRDGAAEEKKSIQNVWENVYGLNVCVWVWVGLCGGGIFSASSQKYDNV